MRRITLFIAAAVMVIALTLAATLAWRVKTALDAARPDDMPGWGDIAFGADELRDPAATDDAAGLATWAPASGRRPRVVHRLEGVVLQTGRLLVGDRLVATVFEPAPGTRSKVGSFRVNVFDLDTGEPEWRSPPSVSRVFPVGVDKDGVTAMLMTPDAAGDAEWIALRVAAARGATLDPARIVIQRMEWRQAEKLRLGAGRVVVFGDRGIRRSVTAGGPGTIGVGFSTDGVVLVKGEGFTRIGPAGLETTVVADCFPGSHAVDVTVRPQLTALSWVSDPHDETEGASADTSTAQTQEAEQLKTAVIAAQDATVTWNRETPFPAVCVFSDAASSPTEAAVAVHVSEPTSSFPRSRVNVYSAADGKPVWKQELLGPPGVDLFGDRAFGRRMIAPDGTIRWRLALATGSDLAEPAVEGTAAVRARASRQGVMVVDLAAGKGRFLDVGQLGMRVEGAIRVLWAGDDLLVVQGGDAPRMALVDVEAARPRWTMALPGSLDEEWLGLMANDRWIVAGNLVLAR